MSDYKLAGLDGEMTGGTKTLEFYREYQLIQIGVAFDLTDNIYTSDIGFKENEYKWTQEALDVNKFTHERIQAGPSAALVDAEIVAWLRGHNINETAKLIAVGWNVASWDLPFVRYYLPRFGKFLSYRTIDLNAIVFAAERITGLSYNTIKDHAKRYAEKRLEHRCFQPEPAWHNAGFDAAASLAAFEYLVEFLTPKQRWEHPDVE